MYLVVNVILMIGVRFFPGLLYFFTEYANYLISYLLSLCTINIGYLFIRFKLSAETAETL